MSVSQVHINIPMVRFAIKDVGYNDTQYTTIKITYGCIRADCAADEQCNKSVCILPKLHLYPCLQLHILHPAALVFSLLESS